MINISKFKIILRKNYIINFCLLKHIVYYRKTDILASPSYTLLIINILTNYQFIFVTLQKEYLFSLKRVCQKKNILLLI